MLVLKHLIPGNRGYSGGGGAIWYPARDISSESLIIGALEAAFWEMVRALSVETLQEILKQNSMQFWSKIVQGVSSSEFLILKDLKDEKITIVFELV